VIADRPCLTWTVEIYRADYFRLDSPPSDSITARKYEVWYLILRSLSARWAWDLWWKDHAVDLLLGICCIAVFYKLFTHISSFTRIRIGHFCPSQMSRLWAKGLVDETETFAETRTFMGLETKTTSVPPNMWAMQSSTKTEAKCSNLQCLSQICPHPCIERLISSKKLNLIIHFRVCYFSFMLVLSTWLYILLSVYSTPRFLWHLMAVYVLMCHYETIQ